MAAIPQRPALVEQPILFNHKRHQEKDVECYDCHGNIGDLVETTRLVEDFTMDRCIKCHQKEEADEDCLTCHK